ncbi:MAG TPA: hypothetical protein VNM22_07020 [Candidatus Limnocylindrales bacterium]|nr:hypothetical protein [Candidatus Limnocylindrales bacterium]
MKPYGKKVTLSLSILIILFLAQVAWGDRNKQSRPILLGTSGANIKDCCGAGTLGALVQDIFGSQYILSNNHVLARINRGLAGEAIIQPGSLDQTPTCSRDSSDEVANLWAFVPILFSKNTPNTVDAAIASVESGKVNQSGSIAGIGNVSSYIAAPALNMPVKKSGRTTGLTTGTITAVNVTAKISYPKNCFGFPLKSAKFINQIRIAPGSFSASGDSGALVVENCSSSPRAVGLLFAGDRTGTLANPIGSVLSTLNVSMVGVGGFCSTSRTSPETGEPTYGIPSKLIEAARKIKERYEEAILNEDGVVGIGIGLSDIAPDQVAIEVYVKRPVQEMQRVIPQKLEGIRVKILETGEAVAY